MAMLERIVDVLDRLLRGTLDLFTIAMAGALLILLNYAVFSRFVLNDSVSWGEELPAHMLAALTFIGAAYLTRTNEHLGFDSAVRSLSPLPQKVIAGINLLIMVAFGAALAWYGAIAALSFAGRTLVSLDIPIILFRGAMPLGGALITLICAVRFIGLCIGRVTPDDLLPEGDG